MKKNIILLVFIFLWIQNFAQKTTVTGIAPSYAGDVLEFFKYSDQISYKTEKIGSAKVDNEGNFEFKIDVQEITQAYIFLYALEGYIYLEPNKTYEILLPKKQELSKEDILNPFFIRKKFSLRILNAKKEDLNIILKVFDYHQSQTMLEVLSEKNRRKQKTLLDTATKYLDTIYAEVDNQFFRDHKKFRYANLKYLSYMNNKERIIEQAFVNSEVLYNNSAYMTLFNDVFKGVFSNNSNIIDLTRVYDGVRRRSFSKVKTAVMSYDFYQNPDFAELVIIKGLYDLFYHNATAEKSVIAILDSMTTDSPNPQTRLIAKNILEDITKLRINNPAPQFDLENKRGKEVGLKNYKDKFVYLNFYHPESYTCQKEIIFIEKIFSQKNEMLEIVTIFVSEEEDEMKQFLKKNKQYKWTFLHATPNDEVIKNYEVEVYPSYFLISPDGKLLMDYGMSPNENFETIYKSKLKSWKEKNNLNKQTILGP